MAPEKTMKVQACAWGLLLSATALAAHSGERLTLAVSPLQSYAPTNLTVRIHVTPDANNRGLEVSADSGGYFRSSWVQLDGKDAPQTITVELRSLPGGQYEIRGVLVDSTGRACAYAHQQANVLPSMGGS
jgi:hypothetical protein